MIEKIDISKVLFLDIETVSGKPAFDELNPAFKTLWTHKARQILRTGEDPSPEEAAATFKDRAAIYAEFGKIVCISVGVVRRDEDTKKLSVRLKSFANREEAVLLEEFAGLMNQYYNDPRRHYICGHNIKEFDMPYICRRMLVNQMPFPELLQLSGKKPWETGHLLDTMDMWKFGDRKNFTSLKLLAAVLDFPTPKDDIDGSNVGRVFWEEDDLERIAVYCEKDVLATVQLFLRYKRMPLIEMEQVHHVSV
ncbi:MAG: ribonuclease H-like domain-containing protein [Saprospiraceae bacterium]|nr:ribonuclease H-like domain-containing protein [Saprospiraceae bacterium]